MSETALRVERCPIRRRTAVLVSRPPLGRWCYHWHELFPVVRIANGGPHESIYLSDLATGFRRKDVSLELREALDGRPPSVDAMQGGYGIVGEYLIQIVPDDEQLLPAADVEIDRLQRETAIPAHAAR